MTKDASSERDVPEWAMGAIRRMLEQTRRLEDLVELAITGVSMLPDMPRAVEVLARVEKTAEHPDTSRQLEFARHLAELASRELKVGFPVLHGQAIVTLWALLESAIRQLLTDWLINDSSKLGNDQFQRLRIRVADYERLEFTDRMLYLVESLERDLATPLQSGVARFEALLAAVNLSGDAPDRLRKDLFELSQVRNVVAHRAGVADRRVVDSCPWLGLRNGDHLRVSHEQFTKYSRAVRNYIVLLICRVAEAFGNDMKEDREQVWADYASRPEPASGGPAVA